MSHSRNVFVDSLSRYFGKRGDWEELHDTVSSALSNRGYDAAGAKDGVFEDTVQDLNGVLGRETVRAWGKTAGIIILGSLAVLALPEELVYLIGAAVFFLVIKAYRSSYDDFANWIDNTLKRIESAVGVGDLSA